MICGWLALTSDIDGRVHCNLSRAHARLARIAMTDDSRIGNDERLNNVSACRNY